MPDFSRLEEIARHNRALEQLLKDECGTESSPYCLFLDLAGAVEQRVDQIPGAREYLLKVFPY